VENNSQGKKGWRTLWPMKGALGMKPKRCEQIKITPEALALRQLRLKSGLSMWKAGHFVGRSDSYISHIESGRLDVPCGDKLDFLLKAYETSFEEFSKVAKCLSFKSALSQKMGGNHAN
jgi:hypothetical protein